MPKSTDFVSRVKPGRGGQSGLSRWRFPLSVAGSAHARLTIQGVLEKLRRRAGMAHHASGHHDHPVDGPCSRLGAAMSVGSEEAIMRQPCGLLTGTALFLGFTWFPAAAQVTFKEFVDYCFITSMSADGSVAVGAYDDGHTLDAFRWTAAGGVELIGVPKIGEVYISRDGKTIVGTVPDSLGNQNAAIWQGGRQWRLLTPFQGAVSSETHTISSASGVSGDGSVIVGSAYVSTTKAVAFRWDATNGMMNLGTFDESTNSDSYAYGVSADGRTVIGWDYKEGFKPAGPGGPAMNGRRGTIWWDGKERLLHPLGWAGEAWATNDVGSIIVGQFHPSNTNNLLQGASTYRWTAWDGHFENLGAVPVPIGGDQRTYISQPYAVSDDGSVVGGDSGGVNDKHAMIWTLETGMMYVTDFLTLKGVTDHLGWYDLNKTVYISPDGRLVIGYGQKTKPVGKTWIVTLR
jgi:probable HAF family extracellular repeat protein